MAKILIFSDSHTDVQTMRTVVDMEKPDAIIHLGDHIADAEQLKEKYPQIQTFNISSKTDTQSKDEEWIKHIEISGKRFMLTHGNHLLDGNYYLPDGTEKFGDLSSIFLKDINSDNADIILFGHTHAPFVNYRDGKWIMNPGRIGRISGKETHATYGVLKIDSGNVQWSIIEVAR